MLESNERRCPQNVAFKKRSPNLAGKIQFFLNSSYLQGDLPFFMQPCATAKTKKKCQQNANKKTEEKYREEENREEKKGKNKT